MAQIFISYRREDSGGHAGRLRDHLRARFGDVVFHDVDGIQSGQIFESILEQAIDSCQVALVIIGRTWLTCTDEHGRRRLDDPEDWVRIEVRTLLNRNVVVIPVMVGAAAMPRAADLPDDLRGLVKRQGHELRDSSWNADVEALVIRLREVVGPTGRDRSPLAPVLGRKYLSVAIVGLAALLLLAAGAWMLQLMPSTSNDVGPPANATPSSATESPPSLAIDLVVERTADIGDALLTAALRDVQRDHITVTRLLNVELVDTRGDTLEVDEVVPALLDGRKLRAPGDASYTILLTNRSVSHRSSKPPLQNMFFFAHYRFGLLSVRNLDPEVLRQLIADLRPGERAELLRKYLATFIPLTAVLGQAAALGKPVLPKRGSDVDTGCLSDFNNQLNLLIYKLRTGPEICPQEYKDIANAFGQTVANEFNAILQRDRKERDVLIERWIRFTSALTIAKTGPS